MKIVELIILGFLWTFLLGGFLSIGVMTGREAIGRFVTAAITYILLITVVFVFHGHL